MGETTLTPPGSLGPVEAAIIATRWHGELVEELAERAADAVREGTEQSSLELLRCSGSFELPGSCAQAAESLDLDGLIALGVIIEGQTRHYEFLAEAVTSELMSMSRELEIPLISGVLTCESRSQAERRASRDRMDRGWDYGVALLQQIELYRSLEG